MTEDDSASFLGALGEGMAGEDERIILCGFKGDPNTAPPTAWRPRTWKPGADNPFSADANVYATVASFGRATDGTWRRRKETFRAGLALMVDDVGTKVEPEKVKVLRPSAVIETSPGNQQWWYFLREPERDPVKFEQMIHAFIEGRLLGRDPGMSGITRVGRLPGFLNGKKEYGGFQTRLLWLKREDRFTIDLIMDRFGLKLIGQRINLKRVIPDDRQERLAAFEAYMKQMDRLGMLKRDDFDPSGWVEVRCPWINDHTNRADNGAAVRRPDNDNDWNGAFRCHHGHCIGRGWRELTELLADDSWDELNKANAKERKNDITSRTAVF